MAKGKTKTETGVEALNAAHPIKNRGHAYIVLKEAGVCTKGAASARLYTKCVKLYQQQHGITLGKSKAQMQREAEKAARR